MTNVHKCVNDDSSCSKNSANVLQPSSPKLFALANSSLRVGTLRNRRTRDRAPAGPQRCPEMSSRRNDLLLSSAAHSMANASGLHCVPSGSASLSITSLMVVSAHVRLNSQKPGGVNGRKTMTTVYERSRDRSRSRALTSLTRCCRMSTISCLGSRAGCGGTLCSGGGAHKVSGVKMQEHGHTR